MNFWTISLLFYLASFAPLYWVYKIRVFDKIRAKMLSKNERYYSRRDREKFDHDLSPGQSVAIFTGLTAIFPLVSFLSLAWHLSNVKWTSEQRRLVASYLKYESPEPDYDAIAMREALAKQKEFREQELTRELNKVNREIERLSNDSRGRY